MTTSWVAPSSSTPSSSTPRGSSPIPTWWCSGRSVGARAPSSRRSCGARPSSAAGPGWSIPRVSTATWPRPGVCGRWRCDPGGAVRLNPLDPGPEHVGRLVDGEGSARRRRQMELLASLAGACLGRDLLPRERAALGVALPRPTTERATVPIVPTGGGGPARGPAAEAVAPPKMGRQRTARGRPRRRARTAAARAR